MGFIERTISFFKNAPEQKPEAVQEQERPGAFYTGPYNNVFSISFDGEKNQGEAGPIIDYYLDYDKLRLRSWQSYLESEITQMVIKKFTKWVTGSGLKLQSEPAKDILESENIKVDYASLTKNIESRFSICAKSKWIDITSKRSLNKISRTAKINAIIGGDVLVIQRVIKGNLKVQLIDGAHVQSPVFGTDYNGYELKNGNVIKHGIELNKNGEHVAYWVKQKDHTFKRVAAINKESGLTAAFLVYGSEYRLDNHRGIPLISAVLESLKKLDRYKEATVGSAEERQKIAYYIEHGMGSTGENPLAKQIAKASGFGNSSETDIPKDINANELANKVAATTKKMTFNMPQDAKLQQLASTNEINFGDFYTSNIVLICGAIGIPYEVAMSKYDSNFSASRAALKDWEHTIQIEREDWAEQFYQPIYNFWLHIEILKNKVQALGYLEAYMSDNHYVLAAFRNARFIGPGVPHVDPVKEVKAERLKLGKTADNMPLTTIEKATETLNGGDSNQNFEKYKMEYEEFEKLGIKTENKSELNTGGGDE